MVLLAHSEGLFIFHPVLVNFTAGLIPTSFAFDALGAIVKKDSLGIAAWWTLLAAATVTPLTVAAGWWWLLGDPEAHTGHWQMLYHQWLGTSAAVLLIGLALWRGRLYRRGARPGWAYAIAALLFFAALFVQGDLGASMSFGEGLVIEHGAADAAAPAQGHSAGSATSPAHSH
jgi:uncharacterized membrane protein